MAILSTANGPEHEFKRPPLNLPESAENQNGNSSSNSYRIRSLLDMVDYNAFHNPNLLFCLQESKDSLELWPITYVDLAAAVGRCTGWLNYQNIDRAPCQQQGELSEAKPAPVALLMSSDITLFIYVLALMRLGTPVRFSFRDLCTRQN